MNEKDIKPSYTVSKIEVDENTAEPVIVEITESQFDEEMKKNQVAKTEEFDLYNEKNVKEVVKAKVFGLNEYSGVSKRQKIFKKVTSIIFILLVVASLAWTFYSDFFASGNRQRIPFWKIRIMLRKNWYYLIFAFLSLAFLFLFRGSKLSVLCKVTTKRFHFITCFETGLIGAYYNNVTPLAVGGQPFEIYHLSKHGVHGGAASSLPIVAFFLNQLAFVLLCVVSLVLLPKNTFSEFTSALPVIIITMSIIGLVLCMFVPTLVIIFSLTPKICSSLVKFVIYLGGKLRLVKNPEKTTFNVMKTVIHNSNCIKKIAGSPFGFITSILLSIGEQLANASIAYFTLKFFGFDLSERGFIEWMMIIQLCFILYSAISFIPTPGNSGAADISFYTLFSAGVVSGLAFPALMVWRILSFYSIIVLGFVFIKFKKNQEKKKALKQQEPQITPFI